MINFARYVAALSFVLAGPSCADACPFCESNTAEQVRSGIFNDDFGYHLGVAVAPFPVLIAALLLIYYWPASRPIKRSRTRVKSTESSPATTEHI